MTEKQLKTRIEQTAKKIKRLADELSAARATKKDLQEQLKAHKAK